ncbi:MAG: hypothetical protein DMG27_13305 [Acidobacteria bacterium]|nr:MAG: hypothetical protein DMG27_13305 [Acidobacteriota bacterium]
MRNRKRNTRNPVLGLLFSLLTSDSLGCRGPSYHRNTGADPAGVSSGRDRQPVPRPGAGHRNPGPRRSAAPDRRWRDRGTDADGLASGRNLGHGRAGVFAWFLIHFAYFAFFEVFWNGQTPGKRYVHLRVIKDSGRPITAYEAITRNLLRIVDSMPLTYAVAIVSALLSAKSKRLGDYVAGTVVVHERPLARQSEISWGSRAEKRQPPSPAPSVLNLGPLLPPIDETTKEETSSSYDVGRLSPEEFHLMEAFLLRRDQLAVEVRISMARKITQRIAPKLEVSEDDQLRPERLLETLVAQYRNRARFR